MRISYGQAEMTVANSELLLVDFHDFLIKSQHLNDTELGVEFGLSIREIEALKSRMQR